VTSTDECLTPDAVVALLAGELDELATAQLDAHVDGCASCSELLAAVVRSPALVAAATQREIDPVTSQGHGPDSRGSASTLVELIGRIAPGERIGRYVVRDEVGRGGMGVVYAARDPELDRGVAIKLLRASVRGSSQARARLLREARTLASLSHRNLISVYDVGEIELAGQPVVFVAMELVDGPNLRVWRWQQPRSWRDIVAVYLEAARGLQAAHAAGIIHRDFKPGNVMIDARSERVIVLDFGLARVVAEIDPSFDGEPAGAGSQPGGAQAPEGWEAPPGRLTTPRAVLGTPGYLAPELQRGGLADELSDQWALCMAMAEALCGVHPQLERGSIALSRLLAQARLPAALRRVIERGLAPVPRDRHPAMYELCDALERVLAARRRRALGVVAAGGIGSAVVIGAGLLHAEHDVLDCSHAEQRIAAGWNDERRAEVVAAFDVHGGRWAEPARDGALADLDAFAAGWIAEHGATCRAKLAGELSDAQLDVRMACLERARIEHGALVDAFVHADRETVIHARQASAQLPDPAACMREDPVAAPPDDPAARELLAVVHARLAEAHTRERTGHLADARRLLDEADELSRTLGHRRTEAEVLVARASAAMGAGELDAAERELFAAVWAAEDAGDPRWVARAHIEMIWLEGYFRLRFERALDHGAQAGEAIAAAGGDDELEAIRLRNLGWTALHGGDPEHAEQRFTAGLEVLASSGHGEGRDAWVLRGDHAAVLTTLGRHDEASRELEQVRLATEAWLGPDHPELAPVLNNIAALARERGQLADALTTFDRVIRIVVDAWGEEHPIVARALLNRGTVLADMGRNDEAEQSFARAAAIFTRIGGSEHPELAAAWKGQAGVAYARDDLERARTLFERALAVELGVYGERHPSAAVTSTNLAMVLVDLGRTAEALPHHQRALATFRERLGPRHPNLAVVLDGIGFAHEQLGEHELAAASYREAIAIAEAAGAASLPEALSRLGSLELLRGREAEAIAPLERALTLRIDAVDADPRFLARTRFTLARALATRDPHRARELAQAALVATTDDPQTHDEIAAWLSTRGS
jgi:eukaryotic-like serine/threonine-protein kinase